MLLHDEGYVIFDPRTHFLRFDPVNARLVVLNNIILPVVDRSVSFDLLCPKHSVLDIESRVVCEVSE